MNDNERRLASAQLQQGMLQHRAGQIGLAQSHYQRAAKLDPANAQAWYMLGTCALQAGNLNLAAKHFRTSLGLNPQFAEAHNNLGVTLRRMGRHEEAVNAFRDALTARGNYVDAIYNLGVSFEALGHGVAAENAYRQALMQRADDFNANNALGNLLRRQERLADALPLLVQARRLRPDSAHTNFTLAQVLFDLGRFGEALKPAQAAVALEPENSAGWRLLGVTERLQRHTEAAISALRRAIALAPDDDVALSELGVALAEAGQIVESREMLARAKPNERHAERMRWTILLGLPSVYATEAEIDAERERFSRGLDEVAAGLKLDTAQDRLHAYEAACGVATFLLNYQSRDNTALQNRFGDLVSRVMRAAVPNYMQPCAWRARAHGGRLRVGVVSSHLMHHTVSRYYRNLIAALDPERFDVRVWYSGEVRDFSTAHIENHVAAFEQVSEDPLDTAARIHAAQLDVLIYPETGMDTRHHILGALRLAPVQCVLYGHPATSGLPNMDYFVSGRAFEPADAANHYREKLVLLPGLGACPVRPPAAGDGAWLDAHAAGAPIALCLQNHLKLAPMFDAVLAQIAARSGACIGFFVRDRLVGKLFRTRIESAFRAQGLDPARSLAFLPATGHEGYLGAIERATLVLDSPGFSGGATSLDAFSVGAPVLTWQGAMARGRQTAGMLAMMGIDGLVATSEDEYIDRAVALIADAPRRAALRDEILQRSAVLFKHGEVIAAFEAFLVDAVAAMA